jgi:DNA-binding CsgD family transcriptional regulator
MKALLRSMTVEQFTTDPKIIKVFQRHRNDTGGTLEDLLDRETRQNLPNWGAASERRFQDSLEKLLIRIDQHLGEPGQDEVDDRLPPLTKELADKLRTMGMVEISTIVRLNNCYNASGALSLYAFAYRMNRMKVRSWGAKSELQFIEAINRFAQNEKGPAGKSAEHKEANGLDQSLDVLVHSDDDFLRSFYQKNFEHIQDAIRSQGREGLLVSQITAEMGLTWPFKHRSKVLGEFLFKERTQLFHTPKIGKKKFRSIILSLIWAAKGTTRNMVKFSEMSPDELMEASPLSANEKKALTLRFLGEEPKTLEEVGRIMNVTRERVRQHQEKAETKLRTLGINQFAREWLRRNSSKIWAMLSDDDGATVDPNGLKGGFRNCIPGEVLLATVLAGWSIDDVLSLEGDPIDDWWVRKSKV